MPEKKTKGVGYNENVITSKEFDDLEKREAKKKLLGFMRKKKEQIPEKRTESVSEKTNDSERTSIDKLVLKVERLGGKIDSIEEIRHVSEERFSRLSEEIGELRSSLLEKDRAFDRVDAGFRKMEDIVEELQPASLRKELEKRSDGIMKNQARIEALGTQIKEMSKNAKEFRTLLSKIKDVKNLINMSNEISKTLTKIESERRSITKTSGKIETIFSELSKKISEFDSYKDKVDFNADTMHDLMKSLDMLEVKLEGMLKKEDMEKIDESMKVLETSVKDDVRDIKDIVGMLVSSLKKTNLKEIIEKQGIESVGSINDRVSQMQNRIESMEKLSTGLESVKNDMDSLKRGTEYLKTKVDAVEKKGTMSVAAVQGRVTEERRDALSDMVRYIRSCLDLGYNTKQVKHELLDKGWPRKTVNEIILKEVINRRKKTISIGGRMSSDLKKMVVSPTP
jgi:chromosome segregation ATPase